MDLSAILAIVFFAIIAFIGGMGFLAGRKYAWQYSVIKIIVVIVTALIAIILSRVLGDLIVNKVYEYIVNNVLDSSVTETLESLETIPQALEALVCMLIAPILFYPLFAIIKFITYRFIPMITIPVVALFGGKVAPHETEDENGKVKKVKRRARIRATEHKWIGGLVGAACGIMIFIICIAPILGTVVTADGVISTISAVSESDETIDSISDVTDSIANNAGSKTIRFLGGNLVYSSLTTHNFGGERTTLPREVALLSSVGGAVASISDESIDANEKAEDVRAVSDAFARSAIIPTVAAEFISEASAAWDEGNDFMGIDAGSLGDGLLNELFHSMRNSDVNTIKEDMDSIIEIVAICVEKDVFDKMLDDPTVLFEDEDVASDILEAILENERFSVLAGSFADFGIEMVGETLGIPESNENIYDEFITSVTYGYNSDRSKSAISASFDKVGLRINDAIATDVADALEAQLKGDTLTETSAKSFFDKTPVSIIVDKDNGTTEKVTLKDNESIIAYTKRVTVAQIEKAGHDVTDPSHEADALAGAFNSALHLMDIVGTDDFEAHKMVAELGPVLDSFAETETIGKEATALILTGIFQAENIRGNIGFKVVEAADIAASINKGASEESYTSLMTSFAHTVEVVIAASGDGDTQAAVKEMMNNLTPASAEAIKQISTPDMVKSYGVSEQSAVPVSGMVSSMFGNLSDAKEKGMSDEEYEKEAAAVSDLMNIAMSASTDNSSTPMFGAAGESKTGVTAEEYVGRVFDSKVASDTLVETAFDENGEKIDNPLNTESNLNDSEKAELVGALNSQLENGDSSTREEDEKKIHAIGAIMNVKLVIDENGVSIAE